MKHLLASLLLLSTVAWAQPIPVTGTIDIKYNSRATSPPAKGVKDVYTVAVNVANSALFHGTITDQPQLIEGWVSKAVTQPRRLNYDLALDVVNPKNPAQTKNVGRMFGMVPIDSDGTYAYDRGTLEVSVLPMGNAGGFTSKFGGLALGKPLVRPANWADTLRQAVDITRIVNGRAMKVTLRKYDKMEFRQHVLAAGPVQSYQPVTVNGELLYDYDKFSWFFNGVTLQYADGNNIRIDRLSGTIRWVESQQRKTNGEGEYQFDIRVNEPPPSEAAAFSSKVADEASFFETDTTVPALTGTWKYKDVIRGDVTQASSVKVELAGNNLNKQQVMAIAKVILFSSVVPMNAD